MRGSYKSKYVPICWKNARICARMPKRQVAAEGCAILSPSAGAIARSTCTGEAVIADATNRRRDARARASNSPNLGGPRAVSPTAVVMQQQFGTMSFADEYFNRDVAQHEMQVIRDDGVNRHIRFKNDLARCACTSIFLPGPATLDCTGRPGNLRCSAGCRETCSSSSPSPRKPEAVPKSTLRYCGPKFASQQRQNRWRAPMEAPDEFRADVIDYFQR